MDFEEIIGQVGLAMDGVGVLVMVVGVVGALVLYAGRRTGRSDDPEELYRQARLSVGRSILLGLELLVAADIIRTVAVSPSFQSVGVLAAIVAIRTFLSFTLEMEISGRWPWQAEPQVAGAAKSRRAD
ncbi:MAG TPA: DUF1622 domain-containing protein [Actinomycetota bacterium]|nr:DUF1622 domain-containing protein [Actinomycetota bacterium]